MLKKIVKFEMTTGSLAMGIRAFGRAMTNPIKVLERKPLVTTETGFRGKG